MGFDHRSDKVVLRMVAEIRRHAAHPQSPVRVGSASEPQFEGRDRGGMELALLPMQREQRFRPPLRVEAQQVYQVAVEKVVRPDGQRLLELCDRIVEAPHR